MNMSRRSKKDENYYSRWSEPVLRGRCTTFLGVTSDEEISSTRRSPSSSPLLNIRRSASSYFDTCCTCRCYGDKKIRSQEKKKPSDTKIKTQRIRESLELQLIGTQVEEALAGDRQAALIQHLDLATNTLEALIQHVQSLQVSHLASYRVFDFSQQLVAPYNNSSNFQSTINEQLRQAQVLKENRLIHLKSVLDVCAKNVLASERLQSIIDENRVRRDDFSIAANNFKNLLDNSRLSVSQMDKLHKQYERILLDYRDSRRALDAELPKIVRTRLGAIGHSFRMISEFYSDFEYSRQTANFFKLISDNLCYEEPVSDRVTCKDVSPEMCQKCKVNRVDKQ